MSTPSLARRERHDLCDLALEVGEDAPTLCDGWDAQDLVVHLLVRETRPLGAIGIVVPPLAVLTERSMDRLRRRPFARLVEELRDPGLTPFALGPVERLANTLEYAVHHEDLRRGQDDWAPRDLAPEDRDLLWSSIAGMGRMLVRPAGVPVRIRRTDAGAGSEESHTLRSGDDPVVVSGPTMEVVLFLFGRDRTRGLSIDGPPDRVERLRQRTG